MSTAAAWSGSLNLRPLMTVSAAHARVERHERVRVQGRTLSVSAPVENRDLTPLDGGEGVRGLVEPGLVVGDRGQEEACWDVERWAELRREHFVRGVSIKELSRRTGLARNTLGELGQRAGR